MIKSYIKVFFLAVLIFSLNSLQAQILSFNRGEIEFYSSTMLSDIEAVSEKASVKLDVKTGKVEVKIDIESFEFEYDLMQEHFNEKYLESDKFPQAIFNGKIEQDISIITDETEVDLFGNLTIHGVTREIEFKANISKQEDFTVIKSKILVVFNDYNVDDPSILTKSVAKDVEVKCTLYLEQIIE